MEKVFGGDSAIWKDFLDDHLLMINYLFTAVVVPIASNLLGLVYLPYLQWYGLTWNPPFLFYLISCIPIAKK
jgi:hypothetical protein